MNEFRLPKLSNTDIHSWAQIVKHLRYDTVYKSIKKTKIKLT